MPGSLMKRGGYISCETWFVLLTPIGPACIQELNKLGVKCGALHGDVLQHERMITMQRFKEGNLQVRFRGDRSVTNLAVPH